MALDHIRPEFVEAIPEELEQGMLYISIRFRTAAHLCACGCASRIVTPIKPAKWKFTYDGESVSLSPSVGNWQKPCRSHYIIRDNRIKWARAWNADEIAEGRARDQAVLREFYLSASAPSSNVSQEPEPVDGDGFIRRQMKRLVALFVGR